MAEPPLQTMSEEEGQEMSGSTRRYSVGSPHIVSRPEKPVVSSSLTILVRLKCALQILHAGGVRLSPLSASPLLVVRRDDSTNDLRAQAGKPRDHDCATGSLGRCGPHPSPVTASSHCRACLPSVFTSVSAPLLLFASLLSHRPCPCPSIHSPLRQPSSLPVGWQRRGS